MRSLNSNETTILQKILVILFVATIITACVSLVWIIIEKPDKVTKQCERAGGLYSMKPVVLNFTNVTGSNNGLDMSSIQNCTTIINPPMSSGLSTMINISTISGGFFIGAAVYAYTFRKKDEPELDQDLNEEEDDL